MGSEQWNPFWLGSMHEPVRSGCVRITCGGEETQQRPWMAAGDFLPLCRGSGPAVEERRDAESWVGLGQRLPALALALALALITRADYAYSYAGRHLLASSFPNRFIAS